MVIHAGHGEFARIVCATCIVGNSNSYRIDATGDIYETQFAAFADAAPDPDIYSYMPNPLYLDLPLEAGKTWETASALYYYLGTDPVDTVTLSGHVLGPRSVTVPAGDFEVIEVELHYEYAIDNWRSRTEVLWLHRQLGPVNGLESWEGVVPTESPSWGTLKASYR